MQTIRLTHPFIQHQPDPPALSLALGYFDGVHKGHKEVIASAKRWAEENSAKTAVMTFFPHPSQVLRKNTAPVDPITPLEEKAKLIEDQGADILYIVEFTEQFADLEPQEFVDQYIIALNVKHAAAGFDFTYGKLGKGTMEALPFHSRGKFSITTVEKQTDHDRKISSTLIREVIRNGDVAYGAALLGRPHFAKGKVVHGDKRGRTIGFPTANIELSGECLIPPTGVYAVTIEIDGGTHQGVCNIGYKPTFYDEKSLKPSIEVHIFDYNEEIYGKEAAVFWHKRIRSEQKFSGAEELISQIQKDKQAAIQYFQNN
ncbi:bifunctional riboflavin kinase/FAD synthetase [Metabacillus sp. GX 13764]|uniref:bifunctional riboflavin kinase/FAD synthetase n=1 Tax=Metabacillus kandeliae TaxID=2900151 RepID=UPI001E3820B4|nr:bifunctional riboflavin kinase/FAD synthetase [Metabacillus kandeliae]